MGQGPVRGGPSWPAAGGSAVGRAYLNSRNSAIIVNVRHCTRRNECKLSWIAGVRDDHFSDFWKKEVGLKEKRSGEKVESDPLVDDGGTRQLKCMVAGCLPSVHVENFSSYESRRVQIHHGVNDVRRFSHSTHRMQGRQSLMSLDRMHRSLDDSR